jgi:hypothetical protein
MKRVEVVVEREEVNSTKFDGVKELGSAGCLGLGVSVSICQLKNEVAVSEKSWQKSNRTNEPIRSDQIG